MTVLARLSVDVLQRQLRDMHLLLLLQGHGPVLLYDLGALIARIQISAALVDIVKPAVMPSGRLLVTLLYRDALRDLRQSDLVLNLPHAHQLYLSRLVPDRLSWSDFQGRDFLQVFQCACCG